MVRHTARELSASVLSGTPRPLATAFTPSTSATARAAMPACSTAGDRGRLRVWNNSGLVASFYILAGAVCSRRHARKKAATPVQLSAPIHLRRRWRLNTSLPAVMAPPAAWAL